MRRSREKKDMLPLPDAQLRAVPAVPFKNPNNYVQVWPNDWARSSGVPSLRGRRLPPRSRETMMNEDTFNVEVRKFLKEVGVTSQREIESAVRRAVGAGRLKGDEKLKASACVRIESIGLDHRVEGEIALS